MCSLTTSQIVLVVAVLLVYAQHGTSIQCYTCNSEESGDCGDGFNNKTVPSGQCPPPFDHCARLTGTVFGKSMVIRACAVEDACSEDGVKYDSCSTCKTDLCNSSSSITASFILTSIVAAGFFKKYL